MEHTYHPEDLERAIRRTAPGDPPVPDFAAWHQKHADIVAGLKSCPGARADPDRFLPSVLRFGSAIMKTRKRRFGVAAAAAVALTAALLVPGTNKAWSVEQTIAAMKKIETIHITGKARCGGKVGDFDCWVRTPAEGSDLLRLRYQCGCKRKTTIVVKGNTMYQYRPQTNVVHILDCSKMEDLQYWYEGVKISPWLTGKLLETLRLVGRAWQQTTETDPNTGKEQIVVTCNHPASHRSARFIVDPESKLVSKGKVWSNLQREGQPEYDAQVIVYNPPIPDEFFELQVPPGAAVVTQEAEEQAFVPFQQANRLFHREKKYAEAMALYREAHERFPHTDAGQACLRMIGRCYEGLGQCDQAMEAFQKALQEDPEGGLGFVQFYLGRAYLDKGQTQEALKAFEDCLAAGEGIRHPDEFPLKDAREALARLKGR